MKALNLARRGVQATVLATLFLAPALQMWTVGSTTRWSPAELELRYGPLAAATVGGLQQTLGDPPEAWVGAVVGGPWAMRFGPLELIDPIALLGQLRWAPPMALVLGGLLVLALHALFGRAFCGWMSPYGTLSRLISRLRPPFALKGELRGWPRYALLAAAALLPLAGASIAAWLPYLGVGRLFQSLWFGGVELAAVAVLIPLVSDWLLWEHGVCRSLCPSGALQRLVARFRVVRLVPLRKAPCQAHCHDCAESCWLGLDPRAGKPGDDCDSCGRCIGVCPSNRLALGRPRKAA